MRKANLAEKDKVIDVISSTFDTNPGVNWLIKKRGSNKKKIHRLASYAFLKSFLREGAYISSNEKGIAYREMEEQCLNYAMTFLNWQHRKTFLSI